MLECTANLACVGAEPLGLTNCLNFGNPEKPHIAWQLTRAVDGLGDACRALGVPVVGGNVSLYNEGGEGPIYPTPVVGMVGELPDPAARGRLGFAPEGDAIALLGPFRAVAGRAPSSAKLRGERSPTGCPDVDLERVRTATWTPLRDGRARGRLTRAHDVAEGGLACALAECCMAGGIGARVDLGPAARAAAERWHGDAALFGEGAGGVLVSAPLETIEGLAEEAGADGATALGEVGGESLELTAGIATLSVSVEEARAAFHERASRLLLDDSHGAHRARDGPRDECGVFGVYAPEHDVARLAYFALYALQHRGQESAGIATCENGHIMTLRDLGLVSQVFDEQKLRALAGDMAIGHVRYSTTGVERLGERAAGPPLGPPRARARPQRQPDQRASSCTSSCASTGSRFRSTSDSEIIAALLSTHEADAIEDAVADVHAAARGRLLDRRDDPGRAWWRSATRPACGRCALGQLGDRYCVASESCAFDIIGAKLLREVEPGELVSIGERGMETRQVVAGAPPRVLRVRAHLLRPSRHQARGPAHAGVAPQDGGDPPSRGAGARRTS